MNGYCECPKGTIWHPTSDTPGNGLCKSGMTGDCTTNADCKEGKYCKIDGSDCNTPNKGICTTLDNGTKTTYNSKTFLYSSNSVTWWAARNWCLGHGMSLASLADLSCSSSTPSCDDWDGLTMVLGNYSYWTNGSYSSCDTFIIDIRNQSVHLGNHANNGYYPLCL